MQSHLVALTLVVIFLVGTVLAVPYNNYDDNLLDEYKERLENYLMSADKRSCIRRGGSCDGRPNDCCHQSACRCNLWGTNCRCQRAGLFQSLGKKWAVRPIAAAWALKETSRANNINSNVVAVLRRGCQKKTFVLLSLILSLLLYTVMRAKPFGSFLLGSKKKYFQNKAMAQPMY